jgi:hypothetical protein
MSIIKFHIAAEQEMIAAAAYYESQQPTLGRRFLTSIQDAANRIIVIPPNYYFTPLFASKATIESLG